MPADPATPAAPGVPPDPVHVVGAGLLGTSIGLALTAAGVDVVLSDVSVEHLRTATGLGAGRAARTGDDPPRLVVVAVPPDHVAGVVAEALASPEVVVTDVGSVKTAPWAAVREAVGDGAIGRYVGSHPMAGSERSGPLAASAALFDGRPWALTPHPGSEPAAVAAVERLALAVGAVPVVLTPEEHDEAVARTSHLPHLMACLAAGRLVGAPPGQLTLSGQGVRDVTRVAAGDPGLWQQIITANAGAVRRLLGEVRDDLDRLIVAVEAGQRGALGELLERGVVGTRAIPAKHGGPVVPTIEVYVAVPDRPGELARLFADVTEIGVNVEDLRIDHDPGRPVGLVELTVAESEAADLLSALETRTWTTHR